MRRFTTALLVCGAALAVTASSAAAQSAPSYECAGSGGVIDGRKIVGDLVIPTGAVCQVRNTRILGSVRMENGTRTVGITNTKVFGSITGQGTASFSLDGSKVYQDVTVGDSRIGGRVCDSRIFGDATLTQFRLLLLVGDSDRPATDGSEACARNLIFGSLTLADNTAQAITDTNLVFGDLIARANTGTIGFEKNLVFGRLDCQDNTGGIEGGDNRALDGKRGQCAAL